MGGLVKRDLTILRNQVENMEKGATSVSEISAWCYEISFGWTSISPYKCSLCKIKQIELIGSSGPNEAQQFLQTLKTFLSLHFLTANHLFIFQHTRSCSCRSKHCKASNLYPK